MSHLHYRFLATYLPRNETLMFSSNHQLCKLYAEDHQRTVAAKEALPQMPLESNRIWVQVKSEAPASFLRKISTCNNRAITITHTANEPLRNCGGPQSKVDGCQGGSSAYWRLHFKKRKLEVALETQLQRSLSNQQVQLCQQLMGRLHQSWVLLPTLQRRHNHWKTLLALKARWDITTTNCRTTDWVEAM